MEAGEFFHRETLALVDAYHEPKYDGFLAGRGYVTGVIPYDEFLRDYIRNEPLTQDVLERFGWGVNRQSGCSTVEVYKSRIGKETWALWHDDRGLTLIKFDEHERSREHLRLPTPATLRDLLSVLRVFGVETPA